MSAQPFLLNLKYSTLMYRYRFGILLLLLSSFFRLPAQPCQVEVAGLLVDKETAAPLAYATIFIKELDQTVLTDENGHFVVGDVCPGTYTFVCHHANCHELEHAHEVKRGDPRLVIELEQKSVALEAVEILADRPDLAPSQAVARLRGRELNQTLGQDLSASLQGITGLNQLQTGATIRKPIIHGLHSNRILILNNGIRLEGQQWGSEHAPEIDPFLATQLTVIKGAGAVRYGSGAMAGVILVEPGPLRDSAGIGGKLHLQGFSNGRQGVASGQLDGQLANHPAWSWRLQGTLRRGGNLHSPDYFLENTGLAEQNASATLGYQTSQKGMEVFFSRFQTSLGILSPAHIGSENDLLRAIASPTPFGSDTVGFTYDFRRPYQQVVHQMAKWRGYRRLANGSKWTATYAYQHNRRQEYDKHRPRGTDDTGKELAELDFRIQTHTLEGSWHHPVRNGWRGQAGVFGLYQGNLLRGRPFIPNYILMGGEAFWVETWQGTRWEVEGGLRYDYRWINSAREEAGRDIYTVRNFQNLSGSIGGSYRLTSAWKANANLGNVWRPPHVNELFSDGLHHGAAAVEKGDSTLTPERGWKGILTLSYASPSPWSGEISLYHQQFANFIYQRPAGIDRTIRGSFPLLRYDQAAVRLQGADLSLAYLGERGLQWRGKASWLRTWNLTEDQPLIYMPANWWESSLGYELPAYLRGAGSYVRVSVRHTAEQTLVPNAENPEEADWLPPPAAFTLLGLQAGTQLTWQGIRWDVGLQVDNLLNVAYRNYLDRFRYYADAPGRNVSIRISGNF
jgi:iron complex outermembrane receptor protein